MLVSHIKCQISHLWKWFPVLPLHGVGCAAIKVCNNAEKNSCHLNQWNHSNTKLCLGIDLMQLLYTNLYKLQTHKLLFSDLTN